MTAWNRHENCLLLEAPIFLDLDSSDGEFSDDEVLRILRLRRKCYVQALK